MMNSDTAWLRPPVTEVVLGLQFMPLEALGNAHLALFWNQIQTEYPNAIDAQPIPQFVDGVPIPELGIGPFGSTGAVETRLRLLNRHPEIGTRMLQIQNGWLVVNWLKQDNAKYGGYTSLLKELLSKWALFRSFAEKVAKQTPVANMWEVTYIDHIQRGTVWKNEQDFCKVFPGLLGSPANKLVRLNALQGTWNFALQGKTGGLSVQLQTGRSNTDPPIDVAILTTTARGPIKTGTDDDITESLNFGRSAVVETFKEITSAEAQAYWKG